MNSLQSGGMRSTVSQNPNWEQTVSLNKCQMLVVLLQRFGVGMYSAQRCHRFGGIQLNLT